MGIVLKNVNITGGKLSNTSLPSPSFPDTDIEVNGVAEGSVVAGSTVDIQLSDSLGVVTPTSVTQVGNDFAVVLPDVPPAVTRSTATLMKTGQTTSYRTGDDGDLEAGRATDFLTLDAAPLHNNGTATINTTTARFTDTLGGQTYANDWVLDWSTWNGSTLLGYYRVLLTGLSWNNAIDNCTISTFGGFTGCRMMNFNEANNIYDKSQINFINYSPFNHSSGFRRYYTSTTPVFSTTVAYIIQQTNASFTTVGKTTADAFTAYVPVRTFSLSLLNVLS